MNVQFDTSAEKKQAIYEATLRLIREFGFHGTPMSQIAQEAGVAIGTIYHYFSSKDELIFDLFRFCRAQIHDAIFKQREQALPYPERFVSIWINLVKYYVNHPEVLSFLEQFFSSPYVKTIYQVEYSSCFQDEMSLFLNEGIELGYIKALDLNIISAAYIGTVTSTAKRHINGHYSFREEDMKDMVGIIWNGIKI